MILELDLYQKLLVTKLTNGNYTAVKVQCSKTEFNFEKQFEENRKKTTSKTY